MKIVVAPDSFKGTFSATEVCRALEAGLLRVAPEAEVLSLPLADGGEGTLEVLLAAVGGELRLTKSLDPLGRPIEVEYVLLEGREAVIEMARSSGLGFMAPEERNPWVAGTQGLGLVLMDALEGGAKALTLTLGGSATVDGGVGMARALGFRFLDRRGNPLDYEGGRILGKINRIDPSRVDPRLKKVRVRALCDVTNPLTGPQGAARVFGPQKGAEPAMVERLDLGLEKLSRRFEKDLGKKVGQMPGAGAAGGLGAAVAAFLGGELVSGIDYVLETVRFAEALAGADLLLTGEGAFDSQSLHGKVISGVLARAGARGIPVVVVCGKNAGGALPEGDAATSALRRVWSGTDLGVPASGRYLTLTDLSRLAEMALAEFLASEENEGGPRDAE